MSAVIRPVDAHVGSKIRLRRKELEVSQQALAECIGVTFQQVQKYERGANRVSCSSLVAIATALGVKPSYFVDHAPGTVEDGPAHDRVREVMGLVADMTQGLDCVRSLAALPQERRGVAAEVLRSLANRDGPSLRIAV